jgi:hypothetical protein
MPVTTLTSLDLAISHLCYDLRTKPSWNVGDVVFTGPLDDYSDLTFTGVLTDLATMS